MRTTDLVAGKKKSWFRSPWVAIVLVVAVVWGCVAAFGAYGKYREAAGLRNQSARELEELQEKQADLAGKINDLSTNRGMEAEVRNRYRVVKPGEQLVIVVDNRDSTASATVAGATFWQRVRDFIGW